MNKQRREKIEGILAKISECREELEAIRDEEQEYFDNMPESLQGGDKGQKAEETIGSLQSAIYTLENAESDARGALE